MKTIQSSPEIIVIAHNIRSTHNVGSIFRTCEGFGVKHIILSGYTPYPLINDDRRLPHIANKLTKDIHKTALGAEELVPFSYETTPDFERLREEDFSIIGLEQGEGAVLLSNFIPPKKIALLIGEEVHGIGMDMQKECETLIEIPMKGQKESFNVSVATGIALYALSN